MWVHGGVRTVWIYERRFHVRLQREICRRIRDVSRESMARGVFLFLSFFSQSVELLSKDRLQ